jgi:hypothetical protein
MLVGRDVELSGIIMEINDLQKTFVGNQRLALKAVPGIESPEHAQIVF